MCKSNNKTKTKYYLSDNPINCPDEDSLNFTAKAQDFAKIIRESTKKELRIYGILGKWGVGKTSFVNLIKYHLKNTDQKIEFSYFIPFITQDQNGLYHQLFEHLLPKNKKKYFQDKYKYIFLIFILLIYIINCNFQWTTVVFTTLLSIICYFKHELNIFQYFISLVPGIPKSFVESIHSIATHNALSNIIKNHVVIVIDDIDRFKKDDIQSIFSFLLRLQNIKNLSIILPFDKNIILKALEQTEDSKYLEKFCSKSITLNIKWKNQIKEMFDEHLEEHNCSTLTIEYLALYINTPRELKSIINNINYTSYWKACHFDKDSVIVLQSLYYINQDFYDKLFYHLNDPKYQWLTDNEKSSLDKKLMTEVASPQLKQFLINTKIFIIQTDNLERRRQSQLPQEQRDYTINNCLKHYLEDLNTEGVDYITHEELSDLIKQEKNQEEFSKNYKNLTEEKNNSEQRIAYLVMGKKLRMKEKEEFPSVWLEQIAMNKVILNGDFSKKS